MNLSYEDSGFFFFQGAAPPAQAQTLMDLFLREVEMLAVGQVPQAELERAQRQLMAHLLMNLESKPIVAEDIGRQVLAFQKRLSAAELMERIGKFPAFRVSLTECIVSHTFCPCRGGHRRGHQADREHHGAIPTSCGWVWRRHKAAPIRVL